MKEIAFLNPEQVSIEEAKEYRLREAARAVVVDEAGLVALLHAKKYDYYKLPGGGLDDDTDKIVALKRECREEIGCDVEVLAELGTVREWRKFCSIEQISFCYVARVVGRKGAPQLTPEETEEEFIAIWVPYEEACRLLTESAAEKLVAKGYMVPRDTAILESAKEVLAGLSLGMAAHRPTTIISSELLQKIERIYGLTISAVEKVTKGYLSENFILHEGTLRFFLKKYRFSDSQRVREVHSAKHYFAEGGIPVILPFPLPDKQTFFEHDKSYYALFPFVEGRTFERQGLTETAIVSLGRMLARIHLLGKDAILPINDFFKIEDDALTLAKIEKIISLIKAMPVLGKFDRLALQNLELKKDFMLGKAMGRENLSLASDHLIHGDYLDHNVFFGENNTVQWVFDFEKTCYAPRTYELFRSMAYCVLSSDFTEADFEKARLYLRSYREIYPLSADEIERGLYAYVIKCFHGLWIEGEHYLKSNNRVDHFLAEEHRRITYLADNVDSFLQALMK